MCASAALSLGALAVGGGTQRADAAPKPRPANSSPIALSPDEKLVWVVNPSDNSVSVLNAATSRVIRRIPVAPEPQGLAVDPKGKYVYVANTAGGTVQVIRILNGNPARFRAVLDNRFAPRGRLIAGAEPWDVVASPDGRRVFVANSGDDTITVLDVQGRRVIGNVDLRNSVCNTPDRSRHFQPRGLAVTADSKHLYVARFLSFTRPGGRQADDNGRLGAVCQLNIATASPRIRDYRPARLVTLEPRVTGFTIDSTGDGVPDPTSAFPNQLQSVVIWRNSAYLPNIAASPSGPLRFNVDTQAFVNVIDGVNGRTPTDASATKFLNLHLGARNPDPGTTRLFFANPWAIAFAAGRGEGPLYGAGRGDAAYVVSAGSDLLVKVNVDRAGTLSFTGDADTTRYIDLHDPDNPATSGANAGKNPVGITIDRAGRRAWVANHVSRNVTVVDLLTDSVRTVVRTAPLPPPGSAKEVALVGAEVFFSSRGSFDRTPGLTVSTEDRLSSEGWQACSSCHFNGLTDGVVWQFGAGPRKSVPLNGTFNPRNPADQRVLNYSAIFDEVEDFEANVRNVSGPGALATAVACSQGAATGTLDPNHGLLLGDADANLPPCALNAFALKNEDRRQLGVTLPGSTVSVPALTAMKQWIRVAVRTPDAPLRADQRPGGVPRADINQGRRLFLQAGCQSCHGGGKWTLSSKDFTSPPAADEIATETSPAPPAGVTPIGAQFLNRFLRDIGSFNLGVPGAGNDIGGNIGATEVAAPGVVAGRSQPAPLALGKDHNGDGKGNGFNVPSLLGIHAVPPYYHNGACESLACVVGDRRHRT
ncbi:MAG: beta-propeller fold lactonase family protein, partial [Actinomycetota bacterium]